MRPSNSTFKEFINPSICCATSCGDHCNDCIEKSVLQPQTCSIRQDNMCYQGDGASNECCAPWIPEDKLCKGDDNAPCRLSMGTYIGFYSFNSRDLI